MLAQIVRTAGTIKPMISRITAVALADGIGDGVGVVGDLGDEDDVGTAGDAGAQGQPAGVVAHDLDDDDAVVTVGRGVKTVDSFGGDAEGGVETEGAFDERDVVVDGFGYGNDRDLEPAFGNAFGDGMRAAHRSIPTDAEKLRDPHLVQRIDSL